MNDIIKELSLIGVVPVIKIDDAKNALPLAKALVDGGMPCAEVTFRTAAGKDAIEAICKAYPEMLVGAGTVLTTGQVDDAIRAGAKFIVTPGFNPEVVKYCLSKNFPIVPGINNPSGIEQAMALGLDVVKFFPAEQSGGVDMIKAMSAPYGGVKFMPTGGVNPANLNSYLANPKILCCGGSWMVKPELIAAGDFAGITKLVREAVDTMLGLRLEHIGINSENREEAQKTVDTIANLFSFLPIPHSSATFNGTCFEVLYNKGRGTKGHIAIKTNSVDRAVYHLSRRGAKFIPESILYDDKGNMKVAYLDGEIGGFAFHLMK